jgi:microcompartment protein CcmL/EutN
MEAESMQVNYAIGLVEVSALGHAIVILDEMLKAAEVKFVATERKLGGRLVTVVVTGDVSAVNAAVEAGIASAKSNGVYKASNVIPRPHEEILKFLHLDEKEEKPVNSESAATHVGAIPSEKAQEKPVKSASKRRGRPKKSAPKN